MTKKIVALAGDGIGPEIMEAGLEVLEALAKKTGFVYEIDRRPFGGAGIDAAGHPLPDETLKACREADAILLAAIGSPQYDGAVVGLNKDSWLSVRNSISMPIFARL